MKTDKELLELAARAGGVKAYWSIDGSMQQREIFVVVSGGANGTMPYEQEWNPLKLDVDALGLAVELSIDLHFYSKSVEANAWFEGELIDVLKESYSNSKLKATRRAIVRAAAAIGERL